MGCGASSAVRVPHGKEIRGVDVTSVLPVIQALVNNSPPPLPMLVVTA